MNLPLDPRREPEVSTDKSFLLVEKGFDPLREREIESQFALSNGYLGVRASLEEQHPESAQATLIAGVYDSGGIEGAEDLAMAPDWLYTRIYLFGEQLRLERESLVEHRRVLDLRRGVYHRRWRHRDVNGRVTSVSFTRFVSIADPHILLMKITVTPENYSGAARLETGIMASPRLPQAVRVTEAGLLKEDILNLIAATSHSGINVAMAQATRLHDKSQGAKSQARTGDDGVFETVSWHAEMGKPLILEKYVSVFTSRDTGDPSAEATAHVKKMAASGFSSLQLDHIEAWEERWRLAGMDIGGDPSAGHWLNFALYHLLSAGNPDDETVSISARALTGAIYRGHIFWDAETFTLPFLIFTWPAAARSALMYRYHTLDAARENALRAGHRGALYPWESAASGREVAPETVLSHLGEKVPVMSGDIEDHIVADVAHGVWTYVNATGDTGFLLEAGAEIMMETARFWASRAEKKEEEYHLLHVEGPDEYHDQGVDDNYFTNVMAAWNIRQALEISGYLQERHPREWSLLATGIGLTRTELAEWSEVAEKMYRDMNSRGNIIEQFAGYFQLEDIKVRDFEPRTAPLALILGYSRIVASQVVKQADVVMALYLLENELDQEIIRENFEYYDARTDHGSSLSPAIHGLVAARLGKLERALFYFRQAATIDLANNMGNAAGGVHIAAMGGLWQQVVMGFAGVRAEAECLFVYPQLPEAWTTLGFSLLWRGLELNFEIERGRSIRLKLSGRGNVPVGIHGGRIQELAAPRTYLSRWDGDTWRTFMPDGPASESGRHGDAGQGRGRSNHGPPGRRKQ
ncbi:MAG: glycoside hydrolase family 65 protein [Thermoleophilia bacterium]|nr:glycoside hydrolase family 65 protein [Thermoleophilia bacterium]